MLKPTICIVGRTAMKKKSQLVSAALVHRKEVISKGINMIVPMTPASTIGSDRASGLGKA